MNNKELVDRLSQIANHINKQGRKGYGEYMILNTKTIKIFNKLERKEKLKKLNEKIYNCRKK